MKNSVYRMGIAMVLGWCVVFPGPGFSETRDRQPDVYTLGEVVVIGEREGVESVGTLREITAEDIQRKGARTLDEALDLIPGIQIRTGNDGVARVDLRGFRSRHVLLLLDGIPFNSSEDGQFDPSIIPVDAIATIKVSYGNHSVLYDQGGLGGVINIITRKGTRDVRAKVGVEASEQNNWLGRFSVSGASDVVDGFVSGSLLKSDGYPLSEDFDPTPSEDGDVRENSDRTRASGFVNLGYTPSDELSVGVVFNHLNGEYGKPPATIDKTADPLFAKNLKYERVDDYSADSVQVSANYDMAGPLNIRGWAYVNRMDEESNGYDDENYNTQKLKNSFHQDATTTISGANLQAGYDFADMGKLTLGLSMQTQQFEAVGFKMIKNNVSQDTQLEKSLDIYSAALECEINPLEKLGLVLGVSHHQLDREDGGNDGESTFLLGAWYDIFSDTRLRGSVASKIRFPSIKQLYDADSGNPDLTTETSMNYEIGIEQNLPKNSRVMVTGFWIDVDDYIEKDSGGINRNNEEYRFKGVELTAETRFIDNLMLRAGYTYMDTKDRSADSLKDELQHRPVHKVTLEAGYDFDYGLSIYAAMLHVADQYFYSDSATLLPPDNQRALNDYTVINVKISQQIADSGLSLYAGADNLFDEDYEESYGSPREGRTAYAGVEYRF